MTIGDLCALAKGDHEWTLSLYLPLEAVGTRESRQNAVRVKNLLSSARDELGSGMRPPAAEEAIERVREQIEKDLSGYTRQGGLVMFAWPDGASSRLLPQAIDESVTVANRFYLTPLLRLLDQSPDFYALQLSQGGARLFHGSTLEDWEEIPLSEAARSGVPEFRSRAESPEDLQAHSLKIPAESAAIFHGQGGAEAVDDEHVRRYLRLVNSEVVGRLRDSEAPLVFAGDTSLLGPFRRVTTYNRLCKEPVRGTVDDLERRDLYALASQIAAFHYRERRQAELERVHAAVAKERGQTSVAQVIHAAERGRVDTLALAADERVWGRLRMDSGQVQVLPEREPQSEELGNAAAVFTLRNGGRVLTALREELPSGSTVAAVLRF